MKRWWRPIVLTIACVVIGSQALARPPVWIVHGRHSTFYLFGSVHVLPSGLDWAPPELLAALPKATDLWFELPIDQSTDASALRLTREMGYLPLGEKLSGLLSPDEVVRLKNVTTMLSIDESTLEPMRPWLAEVTISLAVDEREGATASRGVEQQLQGLAPSGVRRRSFETARDQIGFLANATIADQIASLDETLHEIEEDPGSYRRVLTGWMAGDLGELETDALTPLRRVSPALYQSLIVDRNRRWALILERQLEKRGVSIVVVGMGHLIGANGVPALLRSAGFRVEGP